MTCYGPTIAYYSKELNPTGKRSLVFNKQLSQSGIPIKLPCGQCIGCRMEKARQWAVRCMHEKRMHPTSLSAFLTLTYSDEFLPEGNTLVKRDLQLFMKRLRLERPAGVRFFACGEYGDQRQRAHYHVLLFNEGFPDRRLYSKSKAGHDQYTSKELDALWGLGACYIGEVTYESCAYVARYIMKKVSGDPARDYYQTLTPDGVLIDRVPEFVTMSRRPGIGFTWFQKHHGEAFQHDSIIANGKEAPIPSYYNKLYEKLDPNHLIRLKRKRRLLQVLRKPDNTKARLRIRETVALAKSKIYNRGNQ
ncbi:replication initiator protein [Blackfly microvirus SF02]|uniref:Replication initiator protein n=1 Tax=Blackfly microvirus SF02 TaxID=2576452 RepID=A0A4P8PTZ6_9VIRU|nr:replication initiator protein [Blackfly microvirus SF02]